MGRGGRQSGRRETSRNGGARDDYLYVPIHIDNTLATAKRRQPVAADEDEAELAEECMRAWALAKAGT